MEKVEKITHIPKTEPKVGCLYKIRGNNNYIESTLEFWKQTSSDEYESFSFIKDDPVVLFLSDIIEVPVEIEKVTRNCEEMLHDNEFKKEQIKINAENPAFSNTVWRGIKHSFIFLVGDKKIATTPFYSPLFNLFFERIKENRRPKKKTV